MTTIQLLESVTATAGSDGRAVGSIGPKRYGETWRISLINTNTNSTSETRLDVYRGIESNSARVLGSYSGNNDTAGGGDPVVVRDGDKLIFVWSNATPGTVCNARLEGEYESRRM